MGVNQALIGIWGIFSVFLFGWSMCNNTTISEFTVTYVSSTDTTASTTETTADFFSTTSKIKSTPITTTTPTAFSTVTTAFQTVEDNHLFYTKTVFDSATATKRQLSREADQQLANDVSYHAYPSDNKHYAALIDLSFPFIFYGHRVRKVAISVKGYIHVHDFLDSTLSFSQYVAPLMADFMLKASVNNSNVQYKDTGHCLHVRWNKVYLAYNNSVGPFTFQASLYENGSIVFGYKEIPLSPVWINTMNYSVKIGVSDGFYFTDSNFAGYQIKVLFRYHIVSVKLDVPQNGSAVTLVASPTCVQRSTCSECLQPITGFTCGWCEKIKLCSAVDHSDRFMEAWFENKCDETATLSRCPLRSGLITAITVCVCVFWLFITIALVCRYAYQHPNAPWVVRLRNCRLFGRRSRSADSHPYGVFYDNDVVIT